MRRLAPILLLAVALVATALVGTAQASPSEYGIKSASASASTTQAGGHPDFTTDFVLKTEKEEVKALPSTTSTTVFDLPPGLLGNPNAVSQCSAAQLVGTDPEVKSNDTGCPQDSQVGIAEVRLFKNGSFVGFTEPIFNMVPGYGEPARLGLFAEVYPVFIDTELRPDRGYAVTARIEGVSSLIPLLSVNSVFWGVPADESHDDLRITAYEAVHGGKPETPSGKRSSGLVPAPFMRNPTRCGEADTVKLTATPYALPDLHSEAIAPLAPNTGCGLVDFKPNFSATSTTARASSGTGLDIELSFVQDGLDHPNVLGESDQRRAEVILPEGVTLNPSQGEGLGACSAGSLANETATSLPNQGCPEGSKVGTVSARSPLLDEAVEGALYVAEPFKNPFNSLIALYMVLKVPDRGVIVKLSGRVELDPVSGQVRTVFDDIPQLPIASLKVHLSQGARAPLVTPENCGTYRTVANFTPWSDPSKVVSTSGPFAVTSGVGGRPCPGATPGFSPSFEAGTVNNNARTYSPFHLRVTRNDGDQELTRISAKLVPGLVAKLAGVSECPDQAIEAARGKSGEGERAIPSCPAGSEIGNVLAGAGVGPDLTYVPGKLYLAGRFRGAPLSIAAIVPAVVGPFDIGTVVTREAVDLDPETAEVLVDGSRGDPVPHILAGIPVRVRDVRIATDRPNFTLNPTNCRPFDIAATLWGAGADPFSLTDDAPASLSQRFQAANCSVLGFKPRLSMSLGGDTDRGSHPSLRAVVRPRRGEANIKRAVVALPRSEFLEQAHIRTICTRVQFAANHCPPGSVYGRARAVTPLLDRPLEGPVYLRSSNHRLPDLVVALKGQVDFNLVGRIDSIRGGIRTTFARAPDAPVTKFTLVMQGGKKGLLVNSRNLCDRPSRSSIELDGQNGRTLNRHPLLRNDCATGSRGN
jgi:hypothetical protein